MLRCSRNNKEAGKVRTEKLRERGGWKHISSYRTRGTFTSSGMSNSFESLKQRNMTYLLSCVKNRL